MLLDGDKCYDIEFDEFSNELIHPVTGEIINNFEDKINCYFEATPFLQEVID